MKLIGQEEVWNNLKKAKAVERAWAWFQGAMSALIGFVGQIPTLFIQAFKSLQLEDIILLPRAFAKVVAVFGKFIGDFMSWAGNAVWNLLEIIFAVVAPGAIPYLKKAAGAFRSILKNPIGFVGNLVQAGKRGFLQFADNIGKYLKTSLIQWLTGTLVGVYLPQSFEIREIIKFVLSVLNLTWQTIRQKLVRVVGEPVVTAMETGLDIVVTLVREGPAAVWEKIKEQVTNLKEIVIEGITSFVTSKIVQSAVTKLVSMLNPVGAVVQAIITIYDTIMFFIERLKQIAQVTMAFLDSISTIAAGVIAAAASRVEQTLAGLLTLAISFLARFAGLGKVSDAVMDIIKKLQVPIEKAVVMGRKVGKFSVKSTMKLVNWWKVRKNFSAGGESHSLFFQGEHANVKLVVASSPIPIIEFLVAKEQNIKDDPEKKKAIAIIRDLLRKVEELIQQASKNDQNEQLQKNIENVMNKMASPLVELLAKDEEWGTPENPAPIAYEKRRAAAYPTFFLTMKFIGKSQSELRSLFVNKTNENKIWQYTPTVQKPAPGGEGPLLGLGSSSQVDVGRKFEFAEKGSRDNGVRNFKDIVIKYGMRPSENDWDVDHVIELQIGGADTFSNLWPLPKSENRSSGSLIKGAKTKLPGKPETTVADAWQHKQKEGKSLWLVVTSTRQRA
jgi:hypothetical protein